MADEPLDLPSEEAEELRTLTATIAQLIDVMTAVTASEVHELPAAEKPASIGEQLAPLIAGITAVVGALMQVVSQTQSFVQALDPGLIQQFSAAIRDLQATMGIAFTGIFEQGINFLQKLAGAVQPLFAALKPVVDQLANQVIKNLVTVFQALVPLVTALLPLVQLLATLFELVSSVLRPIVSLMGTVLIVALAPLSALLKLLALALQPLVSVVAAAMDGIAELNKVFGILVETLLKTVLSALQSIFGGGLQETLKSVQNAFRELTKMVISAAATLALLVGAREFVQNLRKAFNPHGEQATGQTSVQGLEQIAKEMATASINAAGKADAADATNADIVSMLDKLLVAQKDGNAKLIEAILSPKGGLSGAASKGATLALGAVSYADRQLSKPGVFGYTSVNPF